MAEEREIDEQQVENLAAEMVRRADRPHRRIEQVEAEVAEARRQIERQLRQLRQWYVEEAEGQAKLKGLLDQPDADLVAFKTQLRTLMRLPEVTNVTVNRHGVELVTSWLNTVVLSDGHQRQLGRFRILLRFDGGVHCQALDFNEVKLQEMRQRDRYWPYQHPHVYPADHYPYPGANVCFGNVGDSVSQFLNEQQFDAAGALVLQFLVRMNEEHGYSIKSWKVYDPAAPAPEPAQADNELEPVYDDQGRQLGVRVRRRRRNAPAPAAAAPPAPEPEQAANLPAEAPPARRQAAPPQFRWVREACPGRVQTVDGRYGLCDTCQRRVMLDRDGNLRAHGERRRVAV